MIAYRLPDGLDNARSFLSSILFQGRQETRRMKRAWLARAINGGIATGVILLDMMLAAMMFSAYAPSIGDYAFSGAVFAQLILVLMIAVHIKTKYERDVFTQAWLKRLSTIAILLMAIGVSSMIGFAFMDAAFNRRRTSGLFRNRSSRNPEQFVAHRLVPSAGRTIPANPDFSWIVGRNDPNHLCGKLFHRPCA